MNKILCEKVKDLTKDTGLSEKYLNAITEKMGGSIADDSSDSEAIEKVANLIADVAKESQGEATRWAQKDPKTDPKKTKEPKKATKTDDDSDDDSDDATTKRLKTMEEELEKLKAEKAKGDRATEINSAFEKHKIPAFLRSRLSVPEDQKADEYVAAIKQDLITNGLMTDQTEGKKAASEKQVDEAADALLESITAK